MDNLLIDEIIKRASEELNSGDCRVAYKLLQPLIEKKIPAALFLYSTFSCYGTETIKEFEARSVNLLRETSDMGYPPAMFALAACYDTGDLVEKDSIKAAILCKKASDAGYSKAKIYHGLNLFYGSNGIPKNKKLGLDLIKQAVKENADGAAEVLEEIKE